MSDRLKFDFSDYDFTKLKDYASVPFNMSYYNSGIGVAEVNIEDVDKFEADLKFLLSHPPYFESHYIFMCPSCKGKCHSLYVKGTYPNDSLVCKKCVTGEVAPKSPSREKKRYSDYLNLRDVWSDLTFKEYLKQKLYIGRIE